MGNTGHSQVHTDLGALAGEVGAQILHDVLRSTLGHAYHMLSSPAHLSALLHELLLRSLALGAKIRGRIPFVNITADRANKLFHLSISSCYF